MLTDCGTTIVLVGDLLCHRHNYWLARYRIIYHFLLDRRHLFDRVLIADVFDTFFQGDPFHENVDRNVISVSEEPFGCDPQQRETAKSLIGHATMFYEAKCLNSGTQMASPDTLIRLYETYFKFLEKHTHEVLEESMMYIDQVTLNLVFLVGHAQKAGVTLKRHSPRDDLFTLYGCLGDAGMKSGMGELSYGNGSFPLVIHLYDRSKILCMSARKVCDRLNNPDDTLRFDHVVSA
jgi:hypothetical protein